LALSFGVQDFVEGSVIAAVIAVNTAVGFFQEYRAEKTMDALRQLSSPTAFVVRNGESTAIPAKNVVPGDIVAIKTGDVIPADLRMIFASNLEVSEQLLTGESQPGSYFPIFSLRIRRFSFVALQSPKLPQLWTIRSSTCLLETESTSATRLLSSPKAEALASFLQLE
jgi:magnesium-transporting ATPase (P-type)